MRIRTYLVPSLSVAVEKIKRELGPQAVIISAKKAQASQKWWQFGAPQLEVTAAIDVDMPEPKIETSPLSRNMDIISQMTDDKLLPLKNEINALKQFLQQVMQAAQPQSTLSVDTVSLSHETQQAISSDKSDSSERSELVERSIIRNELTENDASFPQMRVSVDHLDVSQEIIKITRHLLRQQVDHDFVNELADHLTADPQGNLLEKAVRYVKAKLPNCSTFNPDLGGQKVLALVGPTGSGKTTTLAKIAGRLIVEQHKKVAFINMDYFRVGALEQLQKYASILNAPVKQVHNRTEFKKALREFRTADVILVDTEGRSPQDHDGILAIAESLAIEEPLKSWVGLVVPASLRGRDLTQVASAFGPTQANHLVVTKCDETSRFGTLFNAPYQTKMPLSYLTMGQKVPEDLEEASTERILDCVFNLSGNIEEEDAPTSTLAAEELQ